MFWHDIKLWVDFKFQLSYATHQFGTWRKFGSAVYIGFNVRSVGFAVPCVTWWKLFGLFLSHCARKRISNACKKVYLFSNLRRSPFLPLIIDISAPSENLYKPSIYLRSSRQVICMLLLKIDHRRFVGREMQCFTILVIFEMQRNRFGIAIFIENLESRSVKVLVRGGLHQCLDSLIELG